MHFCYHVVAFVTYLFKCFCLFRGCHVQKTTPDLISHRQGWLGWHKTLVLAKETGTKHRFFWQVPWPRQYIQLMKTPNDEVQQLVRHRRRCFDLFCECSFFLPASVHTAVGPEAGCLFASGLYHPTGGRPVPVALRRAGQGAANAGALLRCGHWDASHQFTSRNDWFVICETQTLRRVPSKADTGASGSVSLFVELRAQFGKPWSIAFGGPSHGRAEW